MGRYFAALVLIMISLVSCRKSDYQRDSIQQSTAVEIGTNNYATDVYKYDQPSVSLDEDQTRSNFQTDQARRDILNAADDLNSAVRKLNDGDWENDLSRVKRRLNDLEDANDRYSASGGNSNLGSDIDQMRSQLRRLESDNWREVVPDIQRTNRAIDTESSFLRNE